MGTLLEHETYKQAVRQSDAASLASIFAKVLQGDNPLAQGTEGSYERINKDSGARFVLVRGPVLKQRYCISPHCPSDLSERSEGP